ncbi:MAG: hypothetical protein JEZ01_11520 [Labilibaculum sp.]|nr:hypothetical protein [Labilibaculum sp.]MBI9058381.1 hypothetical protein [Labilibaculum sp.]
MKTVFKTTNNQGNVAFQTQGGEIVNQGVRGIKDGNKYDHLIKTNEVKFTSTFTEGTVEDTVSIMCEIIKNHHSQVSELANYLKKENKAKTLESIWDFVFNHIQYKRDLATVEQLSTPARIWLNRSTPNTPTDCDDHSIFVGSLLYCLGIPFSIRMAGYDGKAYSHVYIIAGSVCIDTVLHKFNCEAEYTSKKDRKMQIETLAGHENDHVSGLAALDSLHQSGEDYALEMERIEEAEELNGLEGSELANEEIALKGLSEKQLEITLNEYHLDPEKYHRLGFKKEYWEHMQKALDSIQRGDSLEGIIVRLTDGANWERSNLSPLNGYVTEQGETVGLLGTLEGFFKKIRKKLKRGVKKFGKWSAKNAKKALKAVTSVFKKVGKFLMKINPINIAIRAVLRSMVSRNKKNLAIKMGYGLLSEAEAKQLGVSIAEWKEARRAYAKFAKKYKFLGGKESKLRKVLFTAWKKAAKKANLPVIENLHGLDSLNGRRRRRRKRRRRAAAAKKRALLSAKHRTIRPRSFKELQRLSKQRKAVKKPIAKAPRKMTAYEKERLDFLKDIHKDIAKEEGLGVVATATTGAVLAKVALILAPILSILKKLGLGKMITKAKEKHIENLSKKITNELDPEAKAKLIQRKERAETNLAIFNKVTKTKPESKLPSPRNITSNAITPNAVIQPNGEQIQLQPMTATTQKQAGMNPILIGGLALVAGGFILSQMKDKDKKTNK